VVGRMTTSQLFVAVMLVLLSAAVFTATLDYGSRWLVWFWAAAFLMSTLAAAHSFWRLV
jgi:hypothetical protein